MADLFLNPWSMAAGALLVAAPVVIHLINRVRYRRVRWAAMEFLLKAQKRLRRKLLLQQLLLLLLRCLLVLLVGLLVGRFLGLGAAGPDSRAAAHVVVLDDTPSMADGWRGDDGAPTDAFEQAKAVLADGIAKAAAEATTAQTLEVVRLSDLATPRPFGRLNPPAVDELKAYLAGFRPGPVRVGLAAGLARAKELLAGRGAEVSKVAHVLTDLRAVDWADDAEGIKQALADLTAARVKVHLVDVAHPYRKGDDRRAPLAHDNLAVVELTPARLVAALYDPVEFTLRVRNHGAAELKDVRFSVRVNGDENKGRSVSIPAIPGNGERTVKFELTFDRVGTADKPLDRFSLVTAALETGEPGGLAADNVRHAVVEVRDRLPVLLVEGRPGLRESKDGDGFYLRPVFAGVLRGYGPADAAPRDLDTADLSRYAAVFLLNVPALSEAGVKNLEGYVRAGGGAGFFLGPDVRPGDYNRLLYRAGAGLFPAPLLDQPSRELSDDELQARRFRISQKKLLLRDPGRRTHPALAGLYTDEQGQPVGDADQLERVFGFISVKRHWPAARIGPWRQDRSVAELYCLPNDQGMADFEGPARKVADGLPADDPQFAKYRDVLVKARDDLRRAAASADPLYKLAAVLDGLLGDQQGRGDAAEALVREFWAHPKTADLRTEAARLRDAVKFGDPFYLAKEFGRGRVTVVTTTAGETWTDWPTERPGSASYTPIVKEMATYLSGAGAGENRAVGAPIEVRVDAGRYRPAARRAFVTHDPQAAGPRGAAADPAPVVDLKDQPLTADGDKLVLRFGEATRPGGYLFTLTSVKGGGTAGDAAEAPEYLGFAANLDPREGDLRRVSRDDVSQLAPGVPVHSPADGDWLKELRNKPSDLSETAWLFLLLLAVLVLEQYLSVRLSFHGAAGDAAPSAAAAMRQPAPVSVG